LPEAQVDRFMFKVLVDYPSEEEEFVIAQRVTGAVSGEAPAQANAVTDTAQLARLQALCRAVYVDPALVQYAVKLVTATRAPKRAGLPELERQLSYGASPRATISLVEGARALALLRGRAYTLPEDFGDLAADVLRHRLVLSYEALSDGLNSDTLISQLMARVPLPTKIMEHEKAA
jgi:MoxR-like ATPase